MKHGHQPDDGGFRSKANIALVVFLAIALFFLFAEHRAHLSGLLTYVPYLLLLACPLMHLFMHGGHEHGDHAPGEKPDSSSKGGGDGSH